MKTLILTLPLGHNYGGLLQAYALQKFLLALGHEVETLDIRKSNNTQSEQLKSFSKNIAKLLLRKIKSFPSPEKYANAHRSLINFRDTELKLSPSITSAPELESYYDSQDFEAVIVGSDQVWRPKYSPNLGNYYLDFMRSSEKKAVAISYAASFGVDHWEYTASETKACKILIDDFNAVSVREIEAQDLCLGNFGIQAELMPDPTLLLSSNDYQPLMEDAGRTGCKGKILTYVLNKSDFTDQLVSAIATRLKKATFSAIPKNVVEVSTKEQHKCAYPSVGYWLKCFADADFVVTDSFHGSVFAVLFKKPFISIGNHNRGMARFNSLFTLLDLDRRRLISPPNDIDLNVLGTDINWQKVSEKQENSARKAKAFFGKHLDNMQSANE